MECKFERAQGNALRTIRDCILAAASFRYAVSLSSYPAGAASTRDADDSVWYGKVRQREVKEGKEGPEDQDGWYKARPTFR